jgi:high-affinity iron transporter
MIFETITYLVAAIVLTYMTFWMRDHARGLSADLEARANSALDGRARLGLALLSFQAVGREGLETMVFTLAIVFASSGRAVIIGGLAGLVASMIFAFAVYRLGRRANVGTFFKVVGALLITFGAGILADAIENLQRLQWLPFFTARLWDSAKVLPQSSALGDIFHTFFGYAQRPSVLQLLVYFAYLGTAVSAYLGWARAWRVWGLRLLRRRWLF